MAKRLLTGVFIVFVLIVMGSSMFLLDFELFSESNTKTMKTECDSNGDNRIKLIVAGGNPKAASSFRLVATTCTNSEEEEEELFVANVQELNKEDLDFSWKSLDTVLVTYNKNLKVIKQLPKTTTTKPVITFIYTAVAE